uniref:Uncharacterized protein n=1 Tax=Magallana gigas TaxID=29159 RepID=K1QYX9_MAGGI
MLRAKIFSLKSGILHCKKRRKCSLKQASEQGLGLQTKGSDIWWQGYGGLRFVVLACKLKWLAQFENPPDFIVIHCGANDREQEKPKNC